MKWIEEHQAVCDGDKGCMQCYHIGESLWALSQAQEHIQAKKNQPKPTKPKPEPKWNYKLGRYM